MKRRKPCSGRAFVHVWAARHGGPREKGWVLARLAAKFDGQAGVGADQNSEGFVRWLEQPAGNVALLPAAEPARAAATVARAVVVQSTRRIVATIAPSGRVPLRLRTTRGADAVARFPELAGLVDAVAPHEVVLDGEVVAFDSKGKPTFGLLQQRMHLANVAVIARRTQETRWCTSCSTFCGSTGRT